MLNPTPITQEIPIRKLLISHSSTNMSCDRKFEFHKLYPKIIDNEEKYDTGVGHALHRAYQNYFIHRDKDQAIWVLMKNYPYGALPKKDNPKSLEACYATLMNMIVNEFTYTNELVYLNIGDRENVPCVEVAFEIKLTNINFGTLEHPIAVSFIGYIDLLTVSRLNGNHAVVDLKTHRRTIYDLSPLYQFDKQCMPYGIVLEHLLGHEISTLEAIYYSIFVDVSEPRTVTFPYNKTAGDITDWLFSLRGWLNRFEFYFHNNWFPRAGGEVCLSFNTPCEYIGVCNLRDRPTITRMLTMDRQDITWEQQPFEPDLVFEMEVPEYA